MSQLLQSLALKPVPQKKTAFSIAIVDKDAVSKEEEKKAVAAIVDDAVAQEERHDDAEDGAAAGAGEDDEAPIVDAAQEAKRVKAAVVDRRNIGYDRTALLQRLRQQRGFATRPAARKPSIVPSRKPVVRAVEADVGKAIAAVEGVEGDISTKPKKRTVRKLKGIKLKIEDTVEEEKDGVTVAKPRKRAPRAKKQLIIAEAPIAAMKIGDTTIEKRIKEPEQVILRAPQYYLNNRQAFVSFINNLFAPYKREIEDETGDVSCETRKKKDGPFEPMPHQKLVRDYLSLYTPYRGVLLYHGLGSGKTCSSIGIAEGLKTRNQVIIMTPASLKMNYIEQLKECGDPLFKKNQYWEFVSIEGNPEYVDALSGAMHLDRTFVEKQGGAWLVNMEKPSNFDDLTGDEKEHLNEQLNRMIGEKYKFISYNGLRNNHIDMLSMDGTINPFDNKVVVIDEAHNFISRIVNKLRKKDKKSISMRLYEFLLSAQNCRVVLLTGTPMINYPNEVGILFNILRGYIKTWHIPLNVKTDRKINEDVLRGIFEKEKMLDYLEYKPSSKTLVITRNPFGFVNVRRKVRGKDETKYMGVRVAKDAELSNYDLAKNAQYDDDTFEKYIYSELQKNDIEVVRTGIRVELFKALPDDFDGFKNLFINSDGDVQNQVMFKNRILGLTSYFRSAQEELLPRFDKDKDVHIEKIPMSDYQFGIYEIARQAERKQEKNNQKKKKKQVGKADEIYDDAVSTYRIFSRAFCNFVFPEEMKRPLPKDDEDITQAVEKLNEDDIDDKPLAERLENPDGAYSIEDTGSIKADMEEKEDVTYPDRIKKALTFLKENEEEYLVEDKLEKYSPKFLRMLQNIQDTLEDDSKKGLHLIYSQFRTLEGIGILQLVLEANGFARFKLKKNEKDQWVMDIAEGDEGKPMFALYTGTETAEEKEILRNVFNSTWEYVPKSLSNQMKEISRNNFYGELIKVLMITASGAEGIDLKNIRYVHLTEPYWHPVRLEQVIGRAVRICSHKDLPEALRDVRVYLYLMTFTPDQLKGDASIELKLKDTSRLDGVTPLTSDETLHEISTLKENITRQLMKSVKEAAVDCDVHSKAGEKEGLICVTYGDKVSSKKMSYTPNVKNQASDREEAFNRVTLTWKAVTLKMGVKKYKLRLADDGKTKTDMVYDYDSFERAKAVPGANPKYLGRLVVETIGGKKKAKIVPDEE